MSKGLDQIMMESIKNEVELDNKKQNEEKLNNLKTMTEENVMRDLSIDKYRSKKSPLDPKTAKEKLKYFKIYELYVCNYLTQKQLAEKFNMSTEHINRIIKWSLLQIGEVKPDAELQVSLEQLKRRSQEIQGLIKKTKVIKEKILCFQELRKIDRLRAQLNGTLNTALIDMSEKKTINVQINQDVERRSGSEMKQVEQPEDKKEIEVDGIIVDEDPVFERRTGTDL